MIGWNRALGAIMVLLGAACYGTLSTFVKAAYRQGYSPAEVLSSQFVIGVLALAIIDLVVRARIGNSAATRLSAKNRMKLIVGGSSIGFTGAFYYLSVSLTSVSVAIVLLMQSVWVGVVLEAVLTRRIPSAMALVSSLLVIAGAILATDVCFADVKFDVVGIIYGLLAALSYTAVIWCSGHVAKEVNPARRSLLMIFGGAIVVLAMAIPKFASGFNFNVFWHWGWIVALLGTIAPPFLFTAGAPLTGVGLAAILSSIELPIAIVMASMFLGESFSAIQWSGVVMILVAILLSNVGRQAAGR
jgi:drug/metabolite transporter (DMT)-like permease